ncbi:MAG: aldo/keto reductase [Clostridia bacterium]|nr:aldo/keto reductase [Clostridia bacterium]
MISTKLSNGLSYDMLGFGTYKITGEFDAKQAVLDAISVGYRRIDTAVFYDNEGEIGLALKASPVPRSELFITTKLWTNVNTYQKTIDRINASMEALGVDYLDGLLIHWPHNNNREVWTAMEDLYFQGKLRSIGVSNFKEHHIEELKRFARIMPMVNQVELHPEFRQFELQEYCKKEGILVEAWSPLMRGEALNIPLIKELAEKHNATPSQIILAWDIKEGIAVIPKSTKIARMAENFNALSVNLSDDEVESLNKLHNGVRRYRNPDNHGFGNQGEL